MTEATRAIVFVLRFFAERHDFLHRFCADVPRVFLGLSFAPATR